MRKSQLIVGVLLVSLALAACGGGGANGPSHPQATVAARPSSPAKLSIVSPTNGQVVRTRSVSIRLTLKNARIVKPTTTARDPRKGHIHVLLDGSIISMNYGLKDTIGKLTPGTHTLRVEFVASDHLPFDPRVFQEVAFEVKP